MDERSKQTSHLAQEAANSLIQDNPEVDAPNAKSGLAETLRKLQGAGQRVVLVGADGSALNADWVVTVDPNPKVRYGDGAGDFEVIAVNAHAHIDESKSAYPIFMSSWTTVTQSALLDAALLQSPDLSDNQQQGIFNRRKRTGYSMLRAHGKRTEEHREAMAEIESRKILSEISKLQSDTDRQLAQLSKEMQEISAKISASV